MITPFILYFVKANVALAILYLFYKLSFTKDTFFGLRRLMLLLICITAFTYPLINFDGWMSSSQSPAGFATVYYKIMPEITINTSNTPEATDYAWLWKYSIIVYLSGIVFLFIRTTLELLKIRTTLHNCSRQLINGTKVCVLANPKEPYSFFKWICIYPEMHTSKELEEILVHERTHIREWHSADILLAQLIIILCWFNPFSWLIRQEIRMNHEFLADKHVIISGHDKKVYQYHLIGMEHQPLAAANLYNNFSVLPLKKRIKMLNRKRTRNIMKSKYLMFLPVAALLLLFSNCGNKAKTEVVVKDSTSVTQAPQENATPVVEEQKKLEETVFEVVEEMPEFPGGMSAALNYLSRNIKYPPEAISAKEQGRVIVQFIVTKEGKVTNPVIVKSISPLLDKEAIRVITEMPDWKPGKQRGVPVNVKYAMPIAFKLQ